MKSLAWAILMVYVTGCSGCNFSSCVDPVVDSANEAVTVLDDAINKLTSESGSWQQVLQESISKLTKEAQSTLRNELQTLLQSSVAALQVSVMCTIDFVGTRVKQTLLRLRAELLHKPVPPASPFVCSSAPLVVEFEAWQASRVPSVTLTGYDLRAALDVRLVETTGTIAQSNVLAIASDYQATINLGATGVHFSPRSTRLEVLTRTAPPTVLTAINIIQPQPKICNEDDITVHVQPISLVPRNHTRGDREFNGNGPKVDASVQLYFAGPKLMYTASMTAAETRSDWTTVQGTGSGELSLDRPIPNDHRITAINGPTLSRVHYVDENNREDHERPNNGGPVFEFVFIGDTDGDDVKDGTMMKEARFNAIGLHIVEVKDCVTKAEALNLIRRPGLSPHLMEHLRTLVTPNHP